VRLIAVLLLCGLCGLSGVCTFAGCSSSSPSGAAVTTDGGGNDRALGQSCDPSLVQPCETLTDACSAAVCQSGVCVRVAVDAGPTCSNGSLPVSHEDGGQPEDAAVDAGDAALGNDAGDASGDEVDASPDASDASSAETDASDGASTDASGD
jgi:hypothetical protein